MNLSDCRRGENAEDGKSCKLYVFIYYVITATTAVMTDDPPISIPYSVGFKGDCVHELEDISPPSVKNWYIS